jgi:hypothetical protein
MSAVTDFFKKLFTDDDETLSWTKIAAAIGLTVTAAKALSKSELGAKLGDFMGIGGGNQQPVGYQGKIPDYTGIRSVVGDTYDKLRRPGGGGQRYFSDMAFATPGVAADVSKGITTAVPGNVQELMNAATAQATKSKADNLAINNPTYQARPIITPTPPLSDAARQTARVSAGLAPRIPAVAPTNNINKTLQDLIAASQPRAYGTGQMPHLIAASQPRAYGTGQMPPTPPPTMQMAQGGLASLTHGMYLGGPTDGMADEIPASIDGNQAAALSDGEFVLPADVVSHLGNGNSEAGAQILYSMMERIRKARTGTTAQGKQINPGKMLPQ